MGCHSTRLTRLCCATLSRVLLDPSLLSRTSSNVLPTSSAAYNKPSACSLAIQATILVLTLVRYFRGEWRTAPIAALMVRDGCIVFGVISGISFFRISPLSSILASLTMFTVSSFLILLYNVIELQYAFSTCMSAILSRQRIILRSNPISYSWLTTFLSVTVRVNIFASMPNLLMELNTDLSHHHQSSTPASKRLLI